MLFDPFVSCVATRSNTCRRLTTCCLVGMLILLSDPTAADPAAAQDAVAIDITVGDSTGAPAPDYPDWEDDEVASIRIHLDPTSGTEEIDLFVIVLAERSHLRLETRGTVDTIGHLIDDAGVDIASDDDGGVGSNFRIEVTVDAGRYLLGIARASGSLGTYRLKTSSKPAP